MSTHTIDKAARPDTRRPMNGALLRMAVTAAASVLFALVNCVEPADGGHTLASPAVAQAAATPLADSLDHPAGADTLVHRN